MMNFTPSVIVAVATDKPIASMVILPPDSNANPQIWFHGPITLRRVSQSSLRTMLMPNVDWCGRFSYLRIIRFLVNPGFKPGIRQLQYFMSHHMRKGVMDVDECERTFGEALCTRRFEGVVGLEACGTLPLWGKSRLAIIVAMQG